ncbi:tyrosine-type recombinase/integrase [Flavobacterium sp.]|jgi:integrase|uniref:site-specific integrase n=1 Tax=Flavobacterium sp. TaxID=239 RepID=UPI0037BE3F08
MIKIVYFLRHAKKKVNGEIPIYVKVELETGSFTLSTGKTVQNEVWEQTHHLRVQVRNAKDKVTKEALEILSHKIQINFAKLEREQLKVTPEQLKAILQGKSLQTASTILKIIDFHNEYFEKLVKINERAPASLQKYKRVGDIVRDFNKKYYGKADYEVEKIGTAYLYNLENFMKFEAVYNGIKGIKNNSIVKYFKNLKTICNHAIRFELIQKNPINKYSGKIKTVEAVFLTAEELESIEAHIFKIERLERVKDIFLFCCYSGYAPVDVMKLTRANLIKDGNGQLWIKTNRQKTGTRANVPLLPQALKIANKYLLTQDTLLPKISNQKMNAYLKEIADIVGLDKKLTWYVARHTFATTVTLGNGIKIENVSAMLGHTTIRQTQHYAKVLDTSVMQDMQKLITKYN